MTNTQQQEKANYTVIYNVPLGAGYIPAFKYVEKNNEKSWDKTFYENNIDPIAINFVFKGKNKLVKNVSSGIFDDKYNS